MMEIFNSRPQKPSGTPIKSLNFGARRKKSEEIMRANLQIAKSLKDAQSTLSRKELNKFAHKSDRYKRQISAFQRGVNTKDPLRPTATPELLRTIRTLSSQRNALTPEPRSTIPRPASQLNYRSSKPSMGSESERTRRGLKSVGAELIYISDSIAPL